MTYRQKLDETWKLTGKEKPFLEWLIDESQRNHKKSVQMSGDLGQAFSRIGELEAKSKVISGVIDCGDVLHEMRVEMNADKFCPICGKTLQDQQLEHGTRNDK